MNINGYFIYDEEICSLLFWYSAKDVSAEFTENFGRSVKTHFTPFHAVMEGIYNYPSNFHNYKGTLSFLSNDGYTEIYQYVASMAEQVIFVQSGETIVTSYSVSSISYHTFLVINTF